MDEEELLQNDIIRVLRIYFNDKPCKDWTTGFQRQFAKDVINLVRQDYELGITELEQKLEKAQNIAFEIAWEHNENVKKLEKAIGVINECLDESEGICDIGIKERALKVVGRYDEYIEENE